MFVYTHLQEEVVIKTELFEKTKVEAEKCLAQSEILANARVEFENEIYTKVTILLSFCSCFLLSLFVH
jgi:hypothetical protein